MPSRTDPKAQVECGILHGLRMLAHHVPDTEFLQGHLADDAIRELALRACADASNACGGQLLVSKDWKDVLAILPAMQEVWRIQTQMVADLAGCLGGTAALNPGLLMYSLFRHIASQACRDIAMRVEQGTVVQALSNQQLTHIIERMTAKIANRMHGRSLSGIIPLISSLGIGVYAYHETALVARTTLEIFSSPVLLRNADGQIELVAPIPQGNYQQA